MPFAVLTAVVATLLAIGQAPPSAAPTDEASTSTTTKVASVGRRAPAATATAGSGTSVTELDVTELRTDLLGTLPSDPPQPDDSPTEPTPAPAPEPTPEPAAEPTPEPTPAPTAEPTQEPTQEPTTDPTSQATPEPTSQPRSESARPEPSATATAEPLATADPAEADLLTAPLSTADYSVIGFTWDRTPGAEETVIRYRTRVDGTWTDWAATGMSDSDPDDIAKTESDDPDRVASDAVVALGADGIQVWADSPAGTVDGLKVVMIDPGTDPAVSAEAGGVVPAAVFVPSQPTVYTRAQWGADESLRTCTPDYSTSMATAAVHHTAGSNDYSPDDVPGILRGILAYHTRPEASGGRGWCDIGYNFVVDKFGRIFEGRAGSIDTTVIGVHTGGFNSRTVGVAAMGEFTSAAPSGAMLESISQLIAWKFAQLGITAGTNIALTSGGGASKYPAGTVVVFPTIYGHRDAQLTSCPGQRLYDSLPDIRARVAELANASVAASPRGAVDRIRANAAGVSVAGWALDPATGDSIDVAVSVDGAVTTVRASGYRPDVASAVPGAGTNHGFDSTVPAPGGEHLVCLTARNAGDGRDVLLGCDRVTVTNAEPIGSVDTLSSTANGIRLAGWTLDPDTTSPIQVHVYVDGARGTALVADGLRPDVGAAFGKGDRHGFDTFLPTSQGQHQVCVYAINVPAGLNATLRCSQVEVGRAPTGSIDTARGGVDSITLAGWALDPDTSASVGVHVYVDGAWARATTASDPRSDIGRIYGLGDAHGFNLILPATQGNHSVCVYAIDTAGGTNMQLGCRTVTVVNRAPTGSIDLAAGSATAITLAGWALDPDTSGPVGVHVYVDGAWGTATTARDARPDIGRIFGLGEGHGFNIVLPASSGNHTVCVYAIDATGGTNVQLGCRSVRVENRQPTGSLDVARGGAGSIALGGWALDPDTSASLGVHVYVDGAWSTATTAADPRPDIALAFSLGASHGFNLVVPAGPGVHSVCVYAIDATGGINVQLACRSVTVT